VDANVRNGVVLTGDVHRNRAKDEASIAIQDGVPGLQVRE